MKIVVSLGGSIINPGKIDINTLLNLKKIIFSSKHSFIIVCGGGSVAREYIDSAKQAKVKGIDLDEIGIRATELNAELVAKIMGVKRAQSLEQALSINDKLVVTNGLFPGVTTDFVSVALSDMAGAGIVVNLSNVKGVYSKDPKKHKDAVFLKKLSYDKLISLANEYELGSGENFIFDLAASKVAKRTKTRVIFMNGLENFSNFLNKKGFIGSVIE
ncbi:MAG: UMP kinase [Candidatus Nanoarchaeia archaeon]|nr:UMP kinase [Candidatus Nanoarchaeia archaeon]MDD5054028.1 UMP kinase [Candidatus Nanoarchaeia archaeon]